jgi:hypothetical protein
VLTAKAAHSHPKSRPNDRLCRPSALTANAT